MSKGEIYLEKADEIVDLLGFSSFICNIWNWEFISKEIEGLYQVAIRSDNPRQVFMEKTIDFLKRLSVIIGISPDKYTIVKRRIQDLFPEEDSTTVLRFFLFAYIIKNGINIAIKA